MIEGLLVVGGALGGTLLVLWFVFTVADLRRSRRMRRARRVR